MGANGIGAFSNVNNEGAPNDMSSIIFHWDTPKGLDTPHGKKKLLSRWNLTCKAFGIKNLICVSSEKVVMTDTEVSFNTVETLDEALELVKNLGVTVFIEQGGESLYEFDHPKEAIYVFGSDYSSLDKYLYKINIPSLLPVHAETAAGIVLSHRFTQCL